MLKKNKQSHGTYYGSKIKDSGIQHDLIRIYMYIGISILPREGRALFKLQNKYRTNIKTPWMDSKDRR